MTSRDTRLERRTRERRRRRGLTALIVILALAPAVAVAWMLTGGSLSLDNPLPAAPTKSRGPSAATEDPAVAAAVEDCRAAWTLQTTSRTAADTSLAQWRGHIDAINQLTAGKITLDQAKQYWARTRQGAKDNAAAYRKADLRYSVSRARCAVPEQVDVLAADVAALRGCVKAAAAGDAVLGAARIAESTWEHHIHDMEAFRAGKLTATQATTMWLQNWRAGAAQMEDYQRAAQQAKTSRCPLT